MGSLDHDTSPRMIATLTLLAVAALTLPTLVHTLHTPAEPHVETYSVACAVVLLIVFIASIPVALSGGPSALPSRERESATVWPMWLALTVLAARRFGNGVNYARPT